MVIGGESGIGCMIGEIESGKGTWKAIEIWKRLVGVVVEGGKAHVSKWGMICRKGKGNN